jgi:hypothetical protein
MFDILVQKRSANYGYNINMGQHRSESSACQPWLSNALNICNGHARPYCVCGSSLLSPAGESEVFLLLEEQGEADDGRVDQQTAKDGHGRRAACDFCRMP